MPSCSRPLRIQRPTPSLELRAAAVAAPPIRCGIADGRTDWAGRVYGKESAISSPSSPAMSTSSEINNTFYRPPEAKNADSWVRRTAALPGFLFSAKLHQDVTHRFTIEASTIAAFREGLEPIRSAGKLSHLGAVPLRFADGPESRDLLLDRESFGGIAELVVEVRHVSWQSPGRLEFLRGLGVTVADLDFPLAKDSFSLESASSAGTATYRHGRLGKTWFDAKAAATKPTTTCPRELARIRERAVNLAIAYRAVTIVANNHYRGRRSPTPSSWPPLTGKKVEVPPALVEEYPRLRESPWSRARRPAPSFDRLVQPPPRRGRIRSSPASGSSTLRSLPRTTSRRGRRPRALPRPSPSCPRVDRKLELRPVHLHFLELVDLALAAREVPVKESPCGLKLGGTRFCPSGVSESPIPNNAEPSPATSFASLGFFLRGRFARRDPLARDVRVPHSRPRGSSRPSAPR